MLYLNPGTRPIMVVPFVRESLPGVRRSARASRHLDLGGETVFLRGYHAAFRRHEVLGYVEAEARERAEGTDLRPW